MYPIKQIFGLDNNIIKSEKVESVMKQVDRGNYVSNNPYMDAPQSIGYSVTISAPHMVSISNFFFVNCSYHSKKN